MGEDRDIKIYVKGENSESNDFVRISDGIDRNKRNGNSDKAKRSLRLFAGICLPQSFIAFGFC